MDGIRLGANRFVEIYSYVIKNLRHDYQPQENATVPKDTKVVRFTVKANQEARFESLFEGSDKWDGMLLHVLAKTGDQTYVAYGLWESEEKMQSAMPEMISLLDRSRHLLEELSSELGVTDPVSGSVVFEA